MKKILLTSISAAVFALIISEPALASAANATNNILVTTVQAPQMTDSKILDIVATVDKGEIASAEVASTKNIAPEVKRYAHYLLKQHSHNLKELAKLEKKTGLQPTPSKISQTLMQQGDQGLMKLKQLDGKEFSTAYIDAMVTGHTDGLNLINTNLLKNASNKKVKHFLLSFRAMVTKHLNKAKKIQAELKN